MLWTRGVAMVTMKLLLAVLLLVVVTPSLVAASSVDLSDHSVGALNDVQQKGLGQDLMAAKEVHIEAPLAAASIVKRALGASRGTTRKGSPSPGRNTTPRSRTTRRSTATSVVPSILTASIALFYVFSAIRWQRNDRLLAFGV